MIPVGRSDIERFRSAIAQRMGLQFDDGKFDFLADILRTRIEQTKSGFADAYISKFINMETGTTELLALAELLTVVETYFFRNPDHFRAFSELVLPACLKARTEQRQIRIVSAGCASGEEAYSIAILIRECQTKLQNWNIRIQGIDINPLIVDKARKARYAVWSPRGTSDDIRSRWFRAEGREFILDVSARSLVSFETRNLIDESPDFWTPQSCDVVFCRNVTMYFAPEVTRTIISRIATALRPGGFLFLGHAETLRGVSHDFHLRHTHDTFYYQRRSGSDQENVHIQELSSSLLTPPSKTLPAVIEFGESWVDAIQRTTDRIAGLAMRHGKPMAHTFNNPQSPAAHSSNCGLESVMKLLHEEKFSEALEALDALPKQGREDTDGRLLRAVILTNGGIFSEAENACREILRFDEMNAGAHYLMALCSEHAGNRAVAIEHDQAAIYLDPGFAMAHFHLGLMARRNGDANVARRELEKAIPLIDREDASRILLFGGGFTRDALVSLCRSELRAIGDHS